MPRRPDVPCAGGCGNLIWRGTGCLPPGQATCQPCRRMEREARPRVRLPRARQPRLLPTCEVCGAAYRRSYASQRTCGRSCGLGLRRRERRLLTCIGCGAEFTRFRSGDVASFCSTTCRPARPARPPKSKFCTECGQPCIRTTCSSECAALRVRRQGLARYGRTPEQVDACARCGQPKRRRGRYCAPCAASAATEMRRRERRRRRARERAVEHEPYTLAEIAERDGFRCGICRKFVDMTLAVPHFRAPTVDHIVPLVDKGPDTKANVRLAHFICNSKRGAGGVVQLALIG